MGVSKLSAKVFLFKKVNYSFKLNSLKAPESVNHFLSKLIH